MVFAIQTTVGLAVLANEATVEDADIGYFVWQRAVAVGAGVGHEVGLSGRGWEFAFGFTGWLTGEPGTRRVPAIE